MFSIPHHQKIEFEWYAALNFKMFIIIRKKRIEESLLYSLSRAVRVT